MKIDSNNANDTNVNYVKDSKDSVNNQNDPKCRKYNDFKSNIFSDPDKQYKNFEEKAINKVPEEKKDDRPKIRVRTAWASNSNWKNTNSELIFKNSEENKR